MLNMFLIFIKFILKFNPKTELFKFSFDFK